MPVRHRRRDRRGRRPRGFWDLDAPIERVGAAATPPPYAPDLERAWLPDRDDIAAAIRRLADAEQPPLGVAHVGASATRTSSAAEGAGDDEVLDLVGALADLEHLGVAVEAGHRRLEHVADAAVDLDGLRRRRDARAGWPSASPSPPP